MLAAWSSTKTQHCFEVVLVHPMYDAVGEERHGVWNNATVNSLTACSKVNSIHTIFDALWCALCARCT